MEQKPQNSILYLQDCPTCLGRGFIVPDSGRQEDEIICPLCRGMGIIAFLAGDFLYWGQRIDNLSIFQNRLQKTFKLIITALLILFGLIGLTLGFLEILKHLQHYSLSLIDLRQHFLGETNFAKVIFWFSLLTDLYAYYRMEQESLIKHTVRQPTPTALRSIPPDVPFEQIESKFKLVELSQFFSTAALEIIQDTWLLAQRRNNKEIAPLHTMVQLLNNQKIRMIFTRLGINGEAYSSRVINALSHQPVATKGKTIFSPDFRKLLFYAYYEAFLAGKKKVEAPQLLLAVFQLKGIAKEIFLDLEVDYQKAKNVVEWINVQENLREQWRRWRGKAVFKPKNTMNRALTARPTPILDSLGRDLTLAARANALFPLIDRKKELASILRIMQSGKGNVLLVGDAGVGKATLIEGLAQLMASEEVPKNLQDKRLVELSTAALVANTGRSGNVEGRMFSVVDEIVAAGNIILYIDDVSNLVGSGGGGMEESVDISDVLVSALSRGLIKVIGTVGKGEFAQYLENNDIIMRNFTKINIEEPDIDTTIIILEAKAGSLEYHYKVFFTYDAIDKTVRLSQRYIHDEYLPSKAIKILEEAAVFASQNRGQNTAVTGEDVAKVISEKTNVQVTKITEAESEKLINLEERIHSRIVDQEEAVQLVASALRRARAELRDEKRPIVNLLFLGPTGVGKTELAKTVAEIYFGGEEKMVRVDMSEYQNQESINRLIGYPPGFRGGTAGGYLTEAVRKSPFSLVLLDEFEKAHPDVLNLFLQVMDDGRLTDGAGRTVDFTNSIIIATSNAGTQQIQDGLRSGQSIEIIKEYLLSEVLKPYFRPELLNRFDGIVVFKPLAMEHVIQIAYLLLGQVQRRLALKGVSLEATEDAVKELAQAGFDPAMGARPLRRVIQERVDNSLADFLLNGKLGRRDIAVLEKGGIIRVKRGEVL